MTPSSESAAQATASHLFDVDKLAAGWRCAAHSDDRVTDVVWERYGTDNEALGRPRRYEVYVTLTLQGSEVIAATLAGSTYCTDTSDPDLGRDHRFGTLTPEQALHLIYHCPVPEEHGDATRC